MSATRSEESPSSGRVLGTGIQDLGCDPARWLWSPRTGRSPIEPHLAISCFNQRFPQVGATQFSQVFHLQVKLPIPSISLLFSIRLLINAGGAAILRFPISWSTPWRLISGSGVSHLVSAIFRFPRQRYMSVFAISFPRPASCSSDPAHSALPHTIMTAILLSLSVACCSPRSGPSPCFSIAMLPVLFDFTS